MHRLGKAAKGNLSGVRISLSPPILLPLAFSREAGIVSLSLKWLQVAAFIQIDLYLLLFPGPKSEASDFLFKLLFLRNEGFAYIKTFEILAFSLIFHFGNQKKRQYI